MNTPYDAPPRRRRLDSYFAPSHEVATALSEGRAEAALEVLAGELDRSTEQRPESLAFLLSQIALCQSRLGRDDDCRATLERIEREVPAESWSSLMLSEGYLKLLSDTSAARHHASMALERIQENEGPGIGLDSKAHNLLAQAMLSEKDLIGAFGAWQSARLPDWRVGSALVDGGFDREKIRDVLSEALPRFAAAEKRREPGVVDSYDQTQRLLMWIESGCPESSKG